MYKNKHDNHNKKCNYDKLSREYAINTFDRNNNIHLNTVLNHTLYNHL